MRFRPDEENNRPDLIDFSSRKEIFEARTIANEVRDKMEERFSKSLVTRATLTEVLALARESMSTPVTRLEKWEDYFVSPSNEVFGTMGFGAPGVPDFQMLIRNGLPVFELAEVPVKRVQNFEMINRMVNACVTTPNLSNGDFNNLPMINSELIRKVGGELISDSSNVQNVHNRLNACVKLNSVAKRGRYPVFNGNLITHIGGKEIDYFSEMENVRNAINGVVSFSDYQSDFKFPVIDGEPIESIDGFDIAWAKSVKNINNKLNCLIRDANGQKILPVINGEVITEIDGYEILEFDNFENIDGKLNGRVLIAEGQWLPVLNGKVVEGLNREIQNCYKIRNVGGYINGEFTFKGIEHRLPVISGNVIRQVDGYEIYDCENTHNIDGTLNGQVKIVNDWKKGDFYGLILRDVVLSKLAS